MSILQQAVYSQWVFGGFLGLLFLAQLFVIWRKNNGHRRIRRQDVATATTIQEVFRTLGDQVVVVVRLRDGRQTNFETILITEMIARGIQVRQVSKEVRDAAYAGNVAKILEGWVLICTYDQTSNGLGSTTHFLDARLVSCFGNIISGSVHSSHNVVEVAQVTLCNLALGMGPQ